MNALNATAGDKFIWMNKIFAIYLPELHNEHTEHQQGICSIDKFRHMHQCSKMQTMDYRAHKYTSVTNWPSLPCQSQATNTHWHLALIILKCFLGLEHAKASAAICIRQHKYFSTDKLCCIQTA